jgi:hypothetical protein
MRNFSFSIITVSLLFVTHPAFSNQPAGQMLPTPTTPTEVANINNQWDNKHNLMGLLGISTPGGLIGVEYGYDVKRNLQVSIGIGNGRGGGQLAGMVRWRYVSKKTFFSHIGLGVSGGETAEDMYPPYRPDGEVFSVKRGIFTNAEVGAGWRYMSGLQLTWILGVSYLTNSSSSECIENCYLTSAGGSTFYTREEADMNKVYIYLGLMVGYTF